MDIPQSVSKSVADFYDHYSQAWDVSRSAPWPGWQQSWQLISQELPANFSCLDLGCGNGRYLKFLLTQTPKLGEYLGLDISRGLLNIASGRFEAANIEFQQRDLSQPWELDRKFDLVSAIAVLHHIPTQEQRVQFIESAANSLQPGGLLLFSIWDFWQDSATPGRIAKPQGQTGPGDYWLSWSAAKEKLRFAHAFSEQELSELLEASGMELLQKFSADGKNAKLNQYYILKNTSAHS
jgi:tRNA (uracil-5-)-methyltransferase TRM9